MRVRGPVPGFPRPTRGKDALFAKGRLPQGEMNATERHYAEDLELRRIAGEVAWWRFEGVKLRLALNTFLTPDFAVMLADGTFELHDTKGSKGIYTDDAKVKMKVAAEAYPFRFVVAYPVKGGGWLREIVGNE